MSEPFYPTIELGSVATITALAQQADLFPDYFDRRECPYEDAVREQLKKAFAPRIVEVAVAAKAKPGSGKTGQVGRPKAKTGIDIDVVSKEIEDIRKELATLKADSKGLETGDRIQIIKTRAGLVEKMVAMAERANGVKKLSLFQSTVLTILDDLIGEDGRQEFMKRIEPFASVEA